MKRLGGRSTLADTAARRGRTGAGRLLSRRVFDHPGKMESHGYGAKTGAVATTLDMPAGQNFVEVLVHVNAAGLGSGVSMTVAVESSSDGVTWYPTGGMHVADVAAKVQTLDKSGRPRNPLRLRLTEQLYRNDVREAHPEWTHVHKLEGQDGAVYYELALEQRYRVTVTTSAPVAYSVEHSPRQNRPRPCPIGRRSASLLGTFSAAEGTGAVTSGSRTTTSGSVIVTAAGAFEVFVGSITVDACTDNKSNTYTKPTTNQTGDMDTGGNAANVGTSYNLAGTRGASHTISKSDQGANSVGACEFDGVETASPVIASGSGSGSGTAMSASPGALSAASLVVGVGGYGGSTTTFAPNGSTSGIEVDENSDQQCCFLYYNVAQTGTPNIAATLAASRTWGLVAVGFKEAAGQDTPELWLKVARQLQQLLAM